MIEIVIVVAIIGVVAAIAAPMMGNTMANFRLSGDARAISNAISLAKMRAAATFTQARAYFDLSGGAYHIEIWSKSSSAWQWDVGSTDLNTRDSFGYGVVTTPPANTQGTIGQASACLNNSGTAIGNTACVLFNSRGIPVDSTGAPTALNAMYVTDGTAVFGVTVSATGSVHVWRTPPTATPTWTAQ